MSYYDNFLIKDDEDLEGSLYFEDPQSNQRTELPKYELNFKKVLNKSTVIFGESGTGKSIMTKYIIKSLQRYIPIVWLVAPTEKQNNTFKGMIQEPFIYYKLESDFIERLYRRQEMATQIYKRANDLKVLEKLFERVSDFETKKYMTSLLQLEQNFMSTIQQIEVPDDRKRAKEKIKQMTEEQLRFFYKTIILNNIRRLEAMPLMKDEINSLKYINFNPRTLIIFDDAALEIKKLLSMRSKKEIMEQFFFMGRWQNITSIFTFQDDKCLDAALCKNAFNTIFCSKTAVNTYYGRASNNFTSMEKKYATAIAEVIFSEKKRIKTCQNDLFQK